jgi:uncharacterized protein YqhQ
MKRKSAGTKKKSSQKLLKASEIKESLAVGGQAIMEGVMMRNDDVITAAVRMPNGKIATKKEVHRPWSARCKVLAWPLVRGMVNLIEIMIIGMRFMMWSGNKSLGEDEEPFSNKELAFTLLFSLVFSVAIFKLLPLFFASIFQERTGSSNFAFNLVDGIIKTSFLVGYIWLISLMKDVKRLFQYHGAEHKSINCYESNKPLTVKNVLASSRFHPRCGTTFILFVFFVSILVYMVIPINTGFWMKLLLRLAFLPLIAGIAYECIKFGGKHHTNPIVKALLAPGMLLQRLTTKEPDGKQAEIAIKSLEMAISKK